MSSQPSEPDYPRDYPCPHCPLAFAYYANLLRHDNLKHRPERGERSKHTCSVCGHKTAQLSNLKTHMRTHTNIRLVCPVEGCQWTYIDPSRKTRHMKKVHGHIPHHRAGFDGRVFTKPVSAASSSKRRKPSSSASNKVHLACKAPVTSDSGQQFASLDTRPPVTSFSPTVSSSAASTTDGSSSQSDFDRSKKQLFA